MPTTPLTMAQYDKIAKNTDANLATLMEGQNYAIYKNPHFYPQENTPPGMTVTRRHLTNPGTRASNMKILTNPDTRASNMRRPEGMQSLDEIDTSFSEIQSLRSELDAKLGELYHLDNSIYSENKMNYDTTIYTGLLWTVLGTSMLYYVFTKL